jgi:hypothetical protein
MNSGFNVDLEMNRRRGLGEFLKVYLVSSGRGQPIPTRLALCSQTSILITFGPGSAKSQILRRSSAGSSGKGVNSYKSLFCCCGIVLRTNIEVGTERRLPNEVKYEEY